MRYCHGSKRTLGSTELKLGTRTGKNRWGSSGATVAGIDLRGQSPEILAGQKQRSYARKHSSSRKPDRATQGKEDAAWA